MFIAFFAYVLIIVVSCVAMAPMFMAGIAFAQDASWWGVYPVLAMAWYILISNMVRERLSPGDKDEESD